MVSIQPLLKISKTFIFFRHSLVVQSLAKNHFSTSSTMSSLPVLSTPQQVLDFWFGDSRSKTDLTLIKSRNGLWFGGASPEFDATQARK